MGAFLTLSHEGGSRNPSSYVSGRHIVGPRGQLGRHPLCRVCWGYLLRAKHFPIAQQRCWGCRDLGERYEKIKIKILKHTWTSDMGANPHPIARRRRFTESATDLRGRVWAACCASTGEALTGEPVVSERLPGISRALSVSVPLSDKIILGSCDEKRGSVVCALREMD
jgi:hypothetical protein